MDTTPRSSLASHAAPYILFLVITWVAGIFEPVGPLVAYPVKLLACAALLIFFWRRGSYPELGTPYRWSLLPLDVALGVALFVLWVAPEGLGIPALGSSSFDPDAAGANLRLPLIAVRLLGAVVLVPFIEELFIRSFVPRFVDAKDKEWHELPIGRFTLVSFAVTVGLFGVAHHRWAVAIAFCAILNLYLMWRRSLGPAIVVHAVTNLALAIYVLHTGQWSFW